MNRYIKYVGDVEFKCSCCGTYKMKAPSFKWTSFITKACLGIICKKCASREAFGNNYKNNKLYQEKWGKK